MYATYVFLAICSSQIVLALEFTQLKVAHKLHTLNNAQVQYLASLSDTDYTESILDNILIPRVVGTPNHDKVYNYIKRQLKDLGLTVEVDEFYDDTPNKGSLKFKNIIATLNPDSERYIVLVCHYDSKYFKSEVFVGATDSAVPCAMMLNLVKVLQKDLQHIKSNNNLSLMLLFLDGEEAFLRWSPTDSIYGARHLAKKWHNKESLTRSGENINQLEKIDAFVLLDLIGTSNPTFFSYFSNTEKLFVELSDAEDHLASLRLLKKYSKNPQQKYFKRRSSPSYVEDDHIPFMKRGVPILHIIPKEFPREWHTPGDSRDILDMNTIENLNKIFRVFIAEYLHLPLDQ